MFLVDLYSFSCLPFLFLPFSPWVTLNIWQINDLLEFSCAPLPVSHILPAFCFVILPEITVGPAWEEAVGRHGRRGGRFHRVWKSKRSSSETPHIRQSLLDTAQSTLNVQVTEHECWWMRLNGGWLHWEKQRHNHELLGKSDDSIWSTEVCLQSMIFRSIQRV